MSLKQDITGIFLLDKASGYSSNSSLQRVKRLWQANKAGHTGTLDPLASGMLPICFGEALKLVRFLLDANKTYQVQMLLGTTTDTGDSQGSILQKRAVPKLSLEEIEAILEPFRGPISQIPPDYSALKQNGIPFYELARQGRASELKKKLRNQHIYSLTLDGMIDESPNAAYLSLTVHCDKGTYIRTLCEDIGEKIGCGAHVVQLRRVLVEPFDTHPMHSLETLMELVESKNFKGLNSLLLKPELAIPHIPKIRVSPDEYTALYQGRSILKSDQNLNSGWLQLWLEGSERFFGIAESLSSGLIIPKRLFKVV